MKATKLFCLPAIASAGHFIPSIIITCLLAIVCQASYAEDQSVGALKPVDGAKAELSGWGIGLDQLPLAKEVGVRQVITFGWNPKNLAPLVQKAKEFNIAVYGCVTPRLDKSFPQQEMNAEENAFRDKIRADKTRDKGGYQFGGEPNLPLEVMSESIACFHHEAVRDEVKKRVKAVVMVDGIAGVAIDFVGYCNYRCCRCAHSMELANAYHAKHPEMSAEQALDAFSLESMVAFYNELADYAHSLKPGIKVTCHVYPTFLPDIFYGNRLKLDECSSTAAWYFKPYWTKERMEEHVKRIFGEEKKYWPSAEAAALVGLGATEDGVYTPKPAERFEFELRTLLEAGADKIYVCSMSSVLKSPGHTAVLKKIFTGK